MAKAQVYEIETPKGRAEAQRQLTWTDHGFLRARWHNFDQVAPGVYRSNQPDHAQFENYAAMGIKSILTLRGAPHLPHFLFEQESCVALGLSLTMIPLSARKAPARDKLVALLDAFDTLERPVLMHCKSGADRTGLAAALYLMVHEDASVEVAKQQLSFKYIHIRKTATGILDHFLRMYDERNRRDPIGIRQWIEDEYDRDELTAQFAARQKSHRFWQGWR